MTLMDSNPDPIPEYTTSTLGTLLEALQRLDQLLILAIQAATRVYGSEVVSDPIRGLYISPAQATRLATRPPVQPSLGAEIQRHKAI